MRYYTKVFKYASINLSNSLCWALLQYLIEKEINSENQILWKNIVAGGVSYGNVILKHLLCSIRCYNQYINKCYSSNI